MAKGTVKQILGLALLGGAAYAGYVYSTDKFRFCGWLQKLLGKAPGFCGETPDPCAGVQCPSGQHCEGGTCVPDWVPLPPPVAPTPPQPTPYPPTNPCIGVVCPQGYHCDNGTCVPDRVAPPPPINNPCPPPARGTQPNCICPDGYLWNGQACVKFPIEGTGHCNEICSKFPFCSDADVQKWLDAWVKSQLTDAEMASILDCWVKLGKCWRCP